MPKHTVTLMVSYDIETESDAHDYEERIRNSSDSEFSTFISNIMLDKSNNFEVDIIDVRTKHVQKQAA